MSKTRRVKKEICGIYVDLDTFEGTIDEIRSSLLDIENKAVEKGFYKDTVKIIADCGYEYTEFSVEAERDETIKERQKRLEKAKKERERKKNKKKSDAENELKELERLAEKHGMKLT